LGFKHTLGKGLVTCFVGEITKSIITVTEGNDSGITFLSHRLVLLVGVVNLKAGLDELIDSFKEILKQTT